MASLVRKRLSVSITASPRRTEKKICYSPVKIAAQVGCISEVLPYLYVSDDRVTNDELRKYGISAILDCRNDEEVELRGLVGDGGTIVERLHLSMRDNKSEDAAKYFVSAPFFIEKQRLASRRVLVHCVRGISRSPAVVLAYLIWSQDQSYRDAFTLLRMKHACSDPNPAFALQLVEFASSKSKDAVAYEVMDGIALSGPLTRTTVEDILNNDERILILVSRSQNCQYLWYNEMKIGEKRGLAENNARMLSWMKLAPEHVEYVSSQCQSNQLSFLQALTEI